MLTKMYRFKSINLSSKVKDLKYFSTQSRLLYSKERVMILGSGWAGFKLAKELDDSRFDVTLISPRNYFLFTPLLASTTTGTLEFRTVTETIRKHKPSVHYIEGSCVGIDFKNSNLNVVPVIKEDIDNLDAKKDEKEKNINLKYDHLIVAVGAISNTFGIKGVAENAYFLKDIKDARKIRRRVMDCFEKASLPTSTEELKRKILNFAVVGGGPTGVEFSAELHDLLKEDMRLLYPDLMPYVRMTLYDVAPNILSSFDNKLSSYATKLFNREGIVIKTQTKISELTEDSILLQSGEKIPIGMVVWATGVTETLLTKELTSKVKKLGWRLATDDQLRLINNETGKIIDSKVYGIGDCATIESEPLACTAQVAEQQALYLSRKFNHRSFYDKPPSPTLEKPFRFNNKGVMAYLGNWHAIVQLEDPLDASGQGKIKQSGYLAWFLWRSAYMTKSVSWRNKLLIPIYWFMAFAFGRDISRF